MKTNHIKLITCFILLGITSACCPGQELPKDAQPIVQLWDGGNVFIQPKKTLILAIWADGKVVSRVDEKGNIKLHLVTDKDWAKTQLKLGRIDPKRVLEIMTEISRSGFFADKLTGLVRPDGPNVILFARNATETIEIHHEAVDDNKTHDAMITPENKQFGKMWDSIMDTLKSVHVKVWRPVEPDDKVVTEIPWTKSGNK